MQLLYFITNRADRIPAVLARLSEAGVNGATVVNCEGMAHMLATSGEAPAFFVQHGGNGGRQDGACRNEG